MGIGELWRVVDWLLKQQNFDCRDYLLAKEYFE